MDQPVKSNTFGILGGRCLHLKIWRDEIAENPRGYGNNLGKIVTWHQRYDDTDPGAIRFDGPVAARKYVAEAGGVILPVYLLDHSGITISTSKFSNAWDSGLYGVIYATGDDILNGRHSRCAEIRRAAQ
jgi:hypothetical protein